MGRGPTAYFIFVDENRASAKAEVEAASEGGKAALGKVAKLIGQRWAALSDEEKQKYKHQAQQLQEEAAAAAAAAQAAEQQGGDGDGGDAAAEEGDAPAAHAAGSGAAPPPPFGLPTSLVKKIVMVDADVSRVSADAIRAIAKAAELFMGQLAVKALEHAVTGKRKNFKPADLEHVAGRDRRMADMGLREILDELAAAAAAAAAAARGGEDAEEGEEGGGKAPAKQTKKQKRDEVAAAGTRHITAFFGAAN